MVTAAIRPAGAADWPRIVSLLATAALPTEDLNPGSVADFTIASDGDKVVGAVAVERHGSFGLLRSLVVERAWRGHGLGQALVAAAEASASAMQIESLTLLTQTAASFFLELGYQEIPRAQAPASLQSSAQFTQLCPATSQCLTKSL